MFDRFTARARRAVVIAQEEARRLGDDFIGPEHLLLGLIREDNTACLVLGRLNVPIDGLRTEMEHALAPVERNDITGHIPFSLEAKRAVESSAPEAEQLGHTYIGTEHLLLGLIREGESAAANNLRAHGAGLGATRAMVLIVVKASNTEWTPQLAFYALEEVAAGGRLSEAAVKGAIPHDPELVFVAIRHLPDASNTADTWHTKTSEPSSDEDNPRNDQLTEEANGSFKLCAIFSPTYWKAEKRNRGAFRTTGPSPAATF